MDGTEALAGADQGTATPTPAQTQVTVTAPPQQPIDTTPTPSTGNIPQAAPPQAPAAAAVAPTRDAIPQRGGMVGILDAVADMLAGKDSRQVSINDQGQQVVSRKPMTRGEQIAKIGLTALTGAARGMAAPPGPSHVSQGIAAGILGQQEDQQNADARQDANAQQDYQRQQKAKIDGINYQLGIRNVAQADLTLKAMGVKATEDMVKFSEDQAQKEKDLGSYDLGTVKDAGQIADVISKLPNWEQDLYRHEGIQPHPVYDESGNRLGLQLYLRRQDVDNKPAPDGTKVPKLVPGDKPGDPPHTEYFTPSGATNAEVDKYNRSYLTDWQTFQKNAADAALKSAQTKEAGANAVKAVAEAGKFNAEARKARVEATNEDPGSSGEAGSGVGLQRQAEMLVHSQLSPSQLSKRAKEYNELLPLANQISLRETGQPFDAEAAETRYRTRQKTIESYATGTPADQITSFNTFLGHALHLSQQIDTLRNSNVKFLNVPLKALREQMGDTRYANIAPQIEAVRKEYQNFLSNNRALHNDDIAEGGNMLNDTMTLGQMQAAVKSFAGAAVTRVGTTNDRYKRVVGTDVPMLLDDGSRKAIQAFGLDGYATEKLKSAWTGQQGQTQGQTQGQPQAQPQQPTPVQLNPGEAPHVNPSTGQQIVLRNNKWVDVKTGQAVQ